MFLEITNLYSLQLFYVVMIWICSANKILNKFIIPWNNFRKFISIIFLNDFKTLANICQLLKIKNNHNKTFHIRFETWKNSYLVMSSDFNLIKMSCCCQVNKNFLFLHFKKWSSLCSYFVVVVVVILIFFLSITLHSSTYKNVVLNFSKFYPL